MPEPRERFSRAEPAIAAVIASRNRADLLDRALHALVHQTMPRESFEVIVVDDGSVDDSRRVVETYRDRLTLTYSYQRQAGLASAKNHGFYRSTAPIILFLDDDDAASPTLLEEHVKTHARLSDDRYAVLGYTALDSAVALDPLMHFVTEVGCFLFSYPKLRDGDLLDFAYFWGGRSSCKRSFLIEHGVFNPVFRFGCEDVELGYRLSRCGLRVFYNAKASSRMLRAVTFDQFCDRSQREGRSAYVFSRLHSDPRVQAWTQVAAAIDVWPRLEPVYGATIEAARKLDKMARRKRELGLTLEASDLDWLHHRYRAAFRAARIRGVVDGREHGAAVN